jgi:hypothetical protein
MTHRRECPHHQRCRRLGRVGAIPMEAQRGHAIHAETEVLKGFGPAAVRTKLIDKHQATKGSNSALAR